MVGDKWFIKKEDGVFGPVSADDLQNLIKNGRITLDQEASQNETGPWEPLKSYELFKERPRPIEDMFEDEDKSSLDENLEAGSLVNETNRSQKKQTSSIIPSSGKWKIWQIVLIIIVLGFVVRGITSFFDEESIEKNVPGKTPLHEAAKRGNSEDIKVLLDRGVDVNAKDEDGWTPLHYAAHGFNDKEYPEAVKVLLNRGADVNAKGKNGYTPLDAALVNAKETFKVLLDRGADVNTKDNEGMTPLHFVALWGKIEAIKVLLNRGADINAKEEDGKTPLHKAAIDGKLEAIKVLLDRGADINAKDKNGWTALMHASKNGHTASVSILSAPAE